MRAGVLVVLTLSASPVLAFDDMPRGLASAVAAGQAPALPATGTIIPPYPDGLTSLGGACVGPPGSTRECVVSIGTLDPEGGGAPIALYSGRQAGQDGEGRLFWTVTDIIGLPTIPDGHFLNYSMCRTDLAGLHPVAVMRGGSAEVTPESTTWTAALELDSGRFVEIAAAAMTCENLLP